MGQSNQIHKLKYFNSAMNKTNASELQNDSKAINKPFSPERWYFYYRSHHRHVVFLHFDKPVIERVCECVKCISHGQSQEVIAETLLHKAIGYENATHHSGILQ